MQLLTLVNVRNVACNRGRDNVIDTEGLNVHIDYKKENSPVQASREPKRVQDSTGADLNILQAEERNDIQQEEEEELEEIVQRPDIEAEILRNIDEEDLRLLDAQPSILNLQTHGLQNTQPASHNRVSQEPGKHKAGCFGAKLQPQQEEGNDGVSAKYLPIILQGRQVT